MDDVIQDINEQDWLCDIYEENKRDFIKEAESQIKTINASIEKTKEELQIARNYLEESQTPYNV